LLTGAKPDLANMQIWGLQVWIHDKSGSKLDGRAKEGWWVGFDDENKAHHIYWVTKRSVIIERNMSFV
jgi:beta-lactamase class D